MRCNIYVLLADYVGHPGLMIESRLKKDVKQNSIYVRRSQEIQCTVSFLLVAKFAASTFYQLFHPT